MNRRVLIVLTLAVVTVTTSGCCARFRNWLHRGSRCGTTTVAPAMMGSPVALGTPYVTPQPAPAMQTPAMAAPTMVPQMMTPQCVPQCMPQCIPVCPQTCNPCPNMCYGGMMEVPCEGGTYFGGYTEEGSTSAAPTSTYEQGTYGGTTYPESTYPASPAGSGSGATPGPQTRTNYPDEENKESTETE